MILGREVKEAVDPIDNTYPENLAQSTVRCRSIHAPDQSSHSLPSIPRGSNVTYFPLALVLPTVFAVFLGAVQRGLNSFGIRSVWKRPDEMSGDLSFTPLLTQQSVPSVPRDLIQLDRQSYLWILTEVCT